MVTTIMAKIELKPLRNLIKIDVLSSITVKQVY